MVEGASSAPFQLSRCSRSSEPGACAPADRRCDGGPRPRPSMSVHATQPGARRPDCGRTASISRCQRCPRRSGAGHGPEGPVKPLARRRWMRRATRRRWRRPDGAAPQCRRGLTERVSNLMDRAPEPQAPGRRGVSPRGTISSSTDFSLRSRSRAGAVAPAGRPQPAHGRQPEPGRRRPSTRSPPPDGPRLARQWTPWRLAELAVGGDDRSDSRPAQPGSSSVRGLADPATARAFGSWDLPTGPASGPDDPRERSQGPGSDRSSIVPGPGARTSRPRASRRIRRPQVPTTTAASGHHVVGHGGRESRATREGQRPVPRYRHRRGPGGVIQWEA